MVSIFAASGGLGGAAMRLWRVLTGGSSLIGPTLVLMPEPAPTLGCQRALTAVSVSSTEGII